MLYQYYGKKILNSKWIILGLLAIIIVNLIILPILDKTIFLSYENYKILIDAFILANLGIGLIIAGLVLIILFREPRDSGMELWMSALPYSRLQIFIAKITIYLTIILSFTLIVPLIFLGMTNVGYTQDLATINKQYGIENLKNNFGKAFGILFGAYLLFILFFSSIYLIATLYLRQVVILMIVFISTIVFVSLSIVPNINQAKARILQNDFEKQNQIKVKKPTTIITNDLEQEISKNDDIYRLEKIKENLNFLAKGSENLDQAIYLENGFSKLGIMENDTHQSSLNLVNPFTYFDVLTSDIYQPIFSGQGEIYHYSNTKSKKLVKKNSSLTRAKNFQTKEAILGERFGKLQAMVNDLSLNISQLEAMLLEMANPINKKEVTQKIENLKTYIQNPLKNLTNYSNWDQSYLQKFEPLATSEANWALVKDEEGNKINLDPEISKIYLQLLGVAKINPNLIFDTEYVDILPTWSIYLILLPLIVTFASWGFYLHQKIKIR